MISGSQHRVETLTRGHKMNLTGQEQINKVENKKKLNSVTQTICICHTFLSFFLFCVLNTVQFYKKFNNLHTCMSQQKAKKKKMPGAVVLDAFFLTGVLRWVFMFVLFSHQEVVRVT